MTGQIFFQNVEWVKNSIIYLFLIFAIPLNAQVKQQLGKEIDKIIRYDTDIDSEKVPGLVIAVIDHDSTYFYSYGTTDKSLNNTPDEHTLFEIGGLTKVFTASLVSVLEDDNILMKDTMINVYLNENEKNINNFNPSLKKILTHTSGLTRLPDDFGGKERRPDNPFAFYTEKDLFDFYRHFSMDKKKEGKYLYSQVGYAILERVITNIVGQPYGAVMQEKLLLPLGMKETMFVLKNDDFPRLARGYNRAGMKTPPWQYQSFAGAIGLKSTAFDLVKFMKAHINEDNRTIFVSMQQPFANTGFDKRSFVGEGWHLIKRKKYFVVTSIGVTTGYRAFMAFVNETKTGVVVLSNSTDSQDNLGMLILKMLNRNWRRKG